MLRILRSVQSANQWRREAFRSVAACRTRLTMHWLSELRTTMEVGRTVGDYYECLTASWEQKSHDCRPHRRGHSSATAPTKETAPLARQAIVYWATERIERSSDGRMSNPSDENWPRQQICRRNNSRPANAGDELSKLTRYVKSDGF